MKKLNMGCGNQILPGYLNRDILELPGVDKIYDFEKFPYPFEANEFDEIYCSHILEHMSDLGGVMEEFTRIGKNGCKIIVKVPYFASPNARGDYTHKRTFNTNSFNYFHPDFCYNKAKIITKNYKIHFFGSNNKMINIIPNFIINLLPKVYERFFAYRFPASEIHYLLEVEK